VMSGRLRIQIHSQRFVDWKENFEELGQRHLQSFVEWKENFGELAIAYRFYFQVHFQYML
jgi:hypothetical protein